MMLEELLFVVCVLLCVRKVLRVILICLAIGNSASHCVLGIVHLLPDKEIHLCTKSCLMLLSFMNVVPPINRECRF